MHDNNATHKVCVDTIFQLYGQMKIGCIIYYGNFGGRDKDYFIVIRDQLDYEHTIVGECDLIFVGNVHFITMLQNFDPLATEPVLSGKSIYGFPINRIKSKLQKRKPNGRNLAYLLRSANVYFGWAIKYFKHNNCFNALNNLCFVVSYCLFAVYYSKDGRSVIALDELKKIEDATLLTMIQGYAKQDKQVSNAEFACLVVETKGLLSKAMKLIGRQDTLPPN